MKDSVSNVYAKQAINDFDIAVATSLNNEADNSNSYLKSDITTLLATINNNVALKLDTTTLSLYYSKLIIDKLINAVCNAVIFKADTYTLTNSYSTSIATNALLTRMNNNLALNFDITTLAS